MGCPYDREDLSAYVDAEVDETTGSGIREHLRVCVACKREVASLKMLSRMVGALPRVEPDTAVTWSTERLAPRTSAALHCPVVLPEASALIDGELNEEDAQAVIGHIAGCTPCHRVYRDLERISEVMAATPPVPAPAGLEARVMAAIEAEGRFSLRRWLLGACEVCEPTARVAFRFAAAAAFVAILALGVLYAIAPNGVSLETVTAPTATVAVVPGAADGLAPAVTDDTPGDVGAPSATGEPARPGPVPAHPSPTGSPDHPTTAGAGGSGAHAPGGSAPTIVRPPGGSPITPLAPGPGTMPAPHGDLSPVGTMMASRPPVQPAPPTDPGRPGTSTPLPAPAKATPGAENVTPPTPPPLRVAERSPSGETDADVHVRVPRRGPSTPVAAPSRGIDPDSLRAAEARLNETVRSVSRSQPRGFTVNP